MEKYHGNTVEFWKENAEEDYIKTPISVLKYIIVLEEQAEQLRKYDVVGRSEQLVCDCGNKLTDKELYFGQCLQCDKNVEEAN